MEADAPGLVDLAIDALDLDLEAVSEAQLAEALKRRSQAGPAERDIYASYVNEEFLRTLERRYGDRIVFQFSFGAEPLPFETASRLSQRAIRQLAEMVSRHPGLHFQCFLASRHANQSLCTLCRELPNLSVAGYWWHNFFPGSMRKLMSERLDMLAANKQIGFFSDAYCVDWTYAKVILVRKQLAEVLAQKVTQGQFSVRGGHNGACRSTIRRTGHTILGRNSQDFICVGESVRRGAARI